MPRGLLDPESQAIEEAAAAAPRVPAALGALARGMYEANIEPLLSPVQTARGLLAAGREFVRDPAGTAKAVAQAEGERLRQAGDKPESAFEYYGGLLSPFSMLRRAPTMSELDVYHGTPHRFPATEANPLGEFDASKIGTGEGAQAYGHGVYLAEDPRVATEYKNKLGMVVSSIDNKPTQNVYEEWAVSALKNFPEPEKAKAYFQNLVDVGLLNGKPPQEMRNYVASVNEAIDRASGKKVGQTIGGSLYKADLPDEMIDRMLDWDKPLSEQPALVKQLEASGFLKQAPAPFSNRYVGPTGTLIDLDSPGGNLVMGGGWNQKTSTALRNAGIPGIKYLDAGSRGQGGTGTRNFVVFPGEENKVRILERK